MSTTIKLRRDKSASWTGSQYKLAEGEIGVALTGTGSNARVSEFRIGDGQNTWGGLSYQNWKPSITTILVDSGSASVSGTTASISLVNTYAPSSSQIVGLTGSYSTGSGTLTVNLLRSGASATSGTISISKVPTASLADTGSSLQTEYSSIDYGSEIVSPDPWMGLDPNDEVSILDFKPNYASPENICLSTNYALFFDGRCSSSYADDQGRRISTEYLYKNGVNNSQYVSGSVEVGASLTARSLVANEGFTSSYGTALVGQTEVSGTLRVVGTDGFDSAAYFSGSVTIDLDSASKRLYCKGPTGFGSETGSVDIRGGNITILRTHQTTAALITSGSIFCFGNITATGVISGSNVPSDRRLKNDIEPILSVDSDRVLSSLKPVEFNWNEKAKELSSGCITGKARGFVADEFQKVLPEACGKIWEEYDSIDYTQVIPFLVAGYQKLKKEVEELREEVKNLKENR